MVARISLASLCLLLTLALAPVGLSAVEEKMPVELADLLSSGGEGYHLRTFGEDRWWFPESAFYVDEGNPAGVWMRGETDAEVLLVKSGSNDRLRLRLRSISVGNVFQVQAGGAEGKSLEVPFAMAPRRKPVPVEISLGAPVLYREASSDGPAASVYRLRLASTHGVVPKKNNPKSTEDRNLGTFVAPR